MEQREGEFKGVGDARIWYQSWRPEAPRALLVIAHGLGEHSGRYGNVVDALLPHGYAVYALDHRGHGRSGGPRGHIDRFSDFTADLGTFIDLLRAAEPGLPLFLYGHSLGGLIALAYALARPEGLRAVVASTPALGRKFEVPQSKLLLARLMSSLLPGFTQHSGLPADRLSHDPQVAAAYVGDPLVHDLVTARLFTEITQAGEVTLANAQKLQLPLLVITSDDDPIVDSEAILQFYERAASPDKALRVYQGYYHECHNEVERARPLADLVAWLDGHMPG